MNLGLRKYDNSTKKSFSLYISHRCRKEDEGTNKKRGCTLAHPHYIFIGLLYQKQ